MTAIVVDIHKGRFPKIKVPIGTSVIWRNCDSSVHSAETRSDSSHYFNAGPILPGRSSSPIEFNDEATVDYVCRYHHGMTGQIEVVCSGPIEVGSPSGGHGPHFKHYHGFVTGGRRADNLYLSHTPILADARHHFQILLRAFLTNPDDIKAYNELRESEYGDGRVDIFHDHLSLPDIGSGKITELPSASLTYRPSGGFAIVPGTKEDQVKVKIDKVILFHQFELDKPYPDGLEYYVYGDDNDVFIDHIIDRAPGFHSVAKLKEVPEFWKCRKGDLVKIRIPTKKIRELPPQIIERAAMIDNTFQLFWLPPAGIYRPNPADPLIPRDDSEPIYDVVLDNGASESIEIGRFVHFDFKLLNYGVLILGERE